MKGVFRCAFPTLTGFAAMILLASPVLAQGHGRSVPPGIARNGNCPPGLAKQGRCGNQNQRSGSDWCWDRNRDGRCDDVYNGGYGSGRRDDDDYDYRRDRRGDVYDRDGRVYDRNGRVYDRNGRVYDRNGNVVTSDRGKEQIRNTIGDLMTRTREANRGRQ